MRNDSIVCPFCPLCCDDVKIASTPNSHRQGVNATGRLVTPACPVASAEFAQALGSNPARIGNETLDAIDVDRLEGELNFSDSPVVMIQHPSIGESKVIEQLVRSEKIRLYSGQTTTHAALSDAIARDGVVSATLGDVLVLADLVWIIGDLESPLPRLLDTLEQSECDQFRTPVLDDRILSQLERMLVDADVDAKHDQDAEPIIRRIIDSRYLALVLGDHAFEPRAESVHSERLLRWLTAWNEKPYSSSDPQFESVHRAVLLEFSADASLANVFRWRNNRTTPSRLAPSAPVEIRLGSSSDAANPPVRLQIGGIDPGVELADAYLPAAVPGVHFEDTVIRGDGSVSLPLMKLASAGDQRTRVDLLCQLLN